MQIAAPVTPASTLAPAPGAARMLNTAARKTGASPNEIQNWLFRCVSGSSGGRLASTFSAEPVSRFCRA